MCGSQRPMVGADSEPISAFDASCDYCGRQQFGDNRLTWHPMGCGINFLCGPCLECETEREVAEDGIDIAAKEAAQEAA